ncbi:glycoside hydrolase family 57 protein [Pseudacidobacterium ailaaui]|jgi:1,4-alpha-glucan branching enzyme|uniref:glycoside hydrolase family 57 protein n=1 Tax=Pseudacidobacterium ailaaui TaxID=1382359 RepID=UPI00047E3D7A|nr:1,4-alpha-glucan branching protein domain-containing protein [Pseudacidobacterium ailaaui]
MKTGRPQGYMTFTLHAHLPYVVHHGTWPHGLEWLLEAAAETYLPLLRVFRRLEADGLALKCNINITPVLLEQLAHPTFKKEFPEYLKRKILSACEDEVYFRQNGERHFAQTARYWLEFFEQDLKDFEDLGRDILKGFRHFNDSGQIEVMTCAATHGYFPLLGTDESITAQVKTAVETHEKYFGKKPRGIWAPECGYRPAGRWQAPVAPAGGALWPPFERIGVEEALAEGGIQYFFVDSHLIEGSVKFTPYELKGGGPVGVAAAAEFVENGSRGFYQPYFVDGPHAHQHPVAVFPRDPKTGVQVWSGEMGYPGDSHYLDFHKKRWPGGHRYWQVTHPKVDLGAKTPYYPERAAARTLDHASHFVGVVYDALKESFGNERTPILASPFDAELFGHWWYEGPLWLEQVARIMAKEEVPIALTSCGEYLDVEPPSGYLALQEGSWGKNGTNEVWLNPDTAWTWTHIYPAETRVRELATEGRWQDGGTGERIMKQLCRELLLLESSDWQFLITTEAARDYAEMRFQTHVNQFHAVEKAWNEFAATGGLRPETEKRLKEIEERDNIFPDVNPELWKKRS